MNHRWVVAGASQTGSLHQRALRPLEDAAASWADGDLAVVAVADGHGHHQHFRSDTGAQLAVQQAVGVLSAAVRGWTDVDAARAGVPGTAERVVAAWRSAVETDVEQHPFAADEPVDTASLTGRLLPYGTTLLAIAASARVLAVLQVGDGDAVLVRSSGEAFRPLPEDPSLDGVHTSSLCQPDPLASLRWAVVDVAADDVALGYLCTDGFGGPQADRDGWWRETGAQLLAFLRDRGVAWVADQLPGWLAEPAAVGGDDTTLAVLAAADLSGGTGPGAAATTVPR